MKNLHIQTQRLKIRPLLLGDLADFYTYRSNPEICKYQGFDAMTLPECKAFILENLGKQFGNENEWVQFGIENTSTKKLIGDCAIKLNQPKTGTAEIGITISQSEQKKGFATEVMRGVLAFLFDQLDVRRVVEIVDVENIASVKLLESIGFRREAHFREHIYFNGKWGSEYQYAMLSWEWKERIT